MKYVMFKDRNGAHYPIIFPEVLIHTEVARYTINLLGRDAKVFADPISAGFVNIGKDTKVYGRSETMDMESRDIDAQRMVMGESSAYLDDADLVRIFEKVKNG